MSLSDSPTSVHLRGARAGDAGSVAWLVERFSPFLYAQAEYRLRGELRRLYSAEDLVQDVWAAVLPRLAEAFDGGRDHAPVLTRYLSTTLLRRVRDLLEKHVAGKPLRRGDRMLDVLPASQSGIVTRLTRRELHAHLHEAIRGLPDRDREILILRGIEQHDNETVGTLLGMGANAVSTAYRRARQRLAAKLPADLVDLLGEP